MHGDHAELLPPALALVIVPIDQAMPEGRLLSLGTGLVTLLVIVRHLNGGCVNQQLGQHHPNLQGCRGAGGFSFVHVLRSAHNNVNINMNINSKFYLCEFIYHHYITFKLYSAHDEPGMCTHQPVTKPLASSTWSGDHGCAKVRM